MNEVNPDLFTFMYLFSLLQSWNMIMNGVFFSFPEHHNSKDKPSKIRHLIPKSRHQSIDTESNTAKKHTRRHHRASDPSADSSTHDSSSGGSRHRRHRRGSNHGSDSPSQDAPASGSKHGHRRKSKNSEDGGSVRKPSSRRSSKGDSLTEISLSDFGSGESGSGLAR